MHDATTHWVKELNTIFIRVVGKDGVIFKVPFSFDRVPGLFTGEATFENESMYFRYYIRKKN